MKRCPECGREYNNTMAFCLDDGVELLYGPALMDEPATAILHSGVETGQGTTRAQVQTTEKTEILSSHFYFLRRSARSPKISMSTPYSPDA